MMATLERTPKNKTLNWCDLEYSQLHSVNRNILPNGKGSQHFGSVGDYYLFGNEAIYEKRGEYFRLTVWDYATKKKWSTAKHEIVVDTVNVYDNKIANDLG